MKRLFVVCFITLAADAQVIDVHMHAPSNDKSAAAMKDAAAQIHLENAVLIGSQSQLASYKSWLEKSMLGEILLQ